MNKVKAEDIAVRALSFLGSDGDRLRRFLDASGLRPETVRSAAASPSFLAGVLDYVMADENLLVQLGSGIGERPEVIAAAQRALSPQPDEG